MRSGSALGITIIVAAGSTTCGFRSLDYLDRGSDSGALSDSGEGGIEPACPPTPPGHLGDVTALAASGAHTCALKRNGKIVCWGDNATSQCGQDHNTPVVQPAYVQVPGVQTRVTTGSTHSCSLDENGVIWCWGQSFLGEIGGANG